MMISTAKEVLAIMKKEHREAELNFKGPDRLLWENPVFARVYEGTYKTVLRGKEYGVLMLGYSGFGSTEYRVTCGDEVVVATA